MKQFTQLAAVVLLTIGLPITALAVADIVNPNTSETNRSGAVAALFLVGLPPSAIGGWLIWDGTRRHQKADRDRLRETFYRLIQEGKGQITSLKFAMETGLEGRAAKQYLDERAKEFNASYDITEEGKFSYFFDGVTPAESSDPAIE